MISKYLLISLLSAILFVILFVLFVNFEDMDNTVIIETNSGLVKGVKVTSDISDFIAFFSIPYAEPPVGDRRFKYPEPVKPWSTLRDATTEGPICIQQNSIHDVSEDCLTLSVYTTSTTGLKPVYIYLHGGGLETDSAKMIDYGPHYFMQHDLVVVVVQFRLGMLGFLNLDIEDAPGNMGLADAIEAIKWVKSNILYFGGNPVAITLGGLSTGGIMTHTLLMSPKSQNLFHKVIIQSGTSLSYRFFIQNVQEPIEKTKEAINMTTATNEEVLKELVTLEYAKLFSITNAIKDLYSKGYAAYFPYSLTKDLYGIVPENPIIMLRNFEYQQLPMFIGRTSKEGIRMFSQTQYLDNVNDNPGMLVPTDLFPIDDNSTAKTAVAETIKEFYFRNDSLNIETISNYVDLCTDSWYGHITDYVVRFQRSQNYSANVYYYMFSVDGAFNDAKINNNVDTPGAAHTDDIGYLWRRPINSYSSSLACDDYSVIAKERYVTFLANFIKYGDPTPEITDLLPIKWEPVKYPEVNYLNFNTTLTMGQDLHRDRLLFWQKLYGYPEV